MEKAREIACPAPEGQSRGEQCHQRRQDLGLEAELLALAGAVDVVIQQVSNEVRPQQNKHHMQEQKDHGMRCHDLHDGLVVIEARAFGGEDAAATHHAAGEENDPHRHRPAACARSSSRQRHPAHRGEDHEGAVKDLCTLSILPTALAIHQGLGLLTDFGPGIPGNAPDDLLHRHGPKLGVPEPRDDLALEDLLKVIWAPSYQLLHVGLAVSLIRLHHQDDVALGSQSPAHLHLAKLAVGDALGQENQHILRVGHPVAHALHRGVLLDVQPEGSAQELLAQGEAQILHRVLGVRLLVAQEEVPPALLEGHVDSHHPVRVDCHHLRLDGLVLWGIVLERQPGLLRAESEGFPVGGHRHRESFAGSAPGE
mmetsp:Transcript_28963/g.68869  ORF Transcript_28963/g.68869 Transcript_28963/m.68869 type:complete len:368 (-) Transcript_28963:17-1120(-)